MRTETAQASGNTSGPPTLSFEGKTFRFLRNTSADNRGEWFCDEKYGMLPPATVLPLEFGKDLTALARVRGIIEAHDYALHPRKVEVKPREESAPRVSERGGMLKVGKAGAHNPFSSAAKPVVGVAPPKKHFPLLKLGKS